MNNGWNNFFTNQNQNQQQYYENQNLNYQNQQQYYEIPQLYQEFNQGSQQWIESNINNNIEYWENWNNPGSSEWIYTGGGDNGEYNNNYPVSNNENNDDDDTVFEQEFIEQNNQQENNEDDDEYDDESDDEDEEDVEYEYASGNDNDIDNDAEEADLEGGDEDDEEYEENEEENEDEYEDDNIENAEEDEEDDDGIESTKDELTEDINENENEDGYEEADYANEGDDEETTRICTKDSIEDEVSADADNTSTFMTLQLTRIPNEERSTRPIMTDYEFVRILGQTDKELHKGAPVLVTNVVNLTYDQLAYEQLMNKRSPHKIIRPLENKKYEEWYANELAIIKELDDPFYVSSRIDRTSQRELHKYLNDMTDYLLGIDTTFNQKAKMDLNTLLEGGGEITIKYKY